MRESLVYFMNPTPLNIENDGCRSRDTERPGSTLIPFCYTFPNGCRAVALVDKRSTRGRHKHCGSATVTFEGAAPPPHMPREPWWEFYVALAVPLNVNPFSGEFRLFGLNRRGVTATIIGGNSALIKKLQRHGRPAASLPQPPHENPSDTRSSAPPSPSREASFLQPRLKRRRPPGSRRACGREIRSSRTTSSWHASIPKAKTRSWWAPFCP